MALAAAARVSPSHFWLHPPSVALKGPPALRDGPAAGGSRFPPPRGRARHPPAAPPPASSSLALALEISLSLFAPPLTELWGPPSCGTESNAAVSAPPGALHPPPPSAHRERPPPPRVYIRHRRVRGARPYAKGRRATLFIFEPKNNRAEINTRPGGGGSGTGGGKGNKAGREPCPPGARPVLPTRAWGAGAPLSALSPTRGGRGGTRPLAAGATSPVPPGRLRLRAAQARAQPGSESRRRLVPGYLRPAAASRPVPRARRARRQKGTSGSAGRHRGRSAVLCKGGEICGGRYTNYCVCCEVRGKNKGIP